MSYRKRLGTKKLFCRTSSSGSSGWVGRGGGRPRNTKSMWAPSAAIFFMTYFYRAGGGGGDGSATDISPFSWGHCSDGSRSFLMEGPPTPKIGLFLNFWPKTAWKWKNLDPKGHASSAPWIRQCTDTPVLDFWLYLLWVSKSGWIPWLHTSSPSCNGALRFTCGVTPADSLMASMAAEPSWSSYLYMYTHALEHEPGIEYAAQRAL